MMRRLIASMLMAMACTQVVASGNNGEGATAKKPAKSSPAKLAYLADQLVVLGQTSKEPLYLLAAAALYRDGIVGNGTPEAMQTLQAIVDQAVDMAQGNEAMARLGDDIVNVKTRAIKASVKEIRGVLPAGQSKSYVAEFEGNSDTSVSLVLDPKVIAQANRQEIDLDLFVRDAERHDVCALQGPGVPEYCGWTPKREGKFQIELVNAGKVDVPFVLSFDK